MTTGRRGFFGSLVAIGLARKAKFILPTLAPAVLASEPITIDMTVLPGGEAEAGRAIIKALTALQHQTGWP